MLVCNGMYTGQHGNKPYEDNTVYEPYSIKSGLFIRLAVNVGRLLANMNHMKWHCKSTVVLLVNLILFK